MACSLCKSVVYLKCTWSFRQQFTGVGTIDLHHTEVSKGRHILTPAYMTQPQLAHCLICHLLLYHHHVKYQLSSASGIHSIGQHWRNISELLENYPIVSSYGKKVDLLHSLAAMLDGWNGHCSTESEDYTNHRPDLDHWWETICLTVDYEYGFERFRFFIVISSVLGYFWFVPLY